MRLTKRQKIGIVVLVLGSVALLLDRMFIVPKDAPGEQTANQVFRYSLGSAQLVHNAPDVPAREDSTPNAKIVRRLDALWSEKALNLDNTRDVFSLPAAWQLQVDPATGPISTSRAALIFARKHQLKAIIMDARQCSVFIDEDFVTIGQELDGFKLVGADSESATFEGGGEQVVLRLKETDG